MSVRSLQLLLVCFAYFCSGTLSQYYLNSGYPLYLRHDSESLQGRQTSPAEGVMDAVRQSLTNKWLNFPSGLGIFRRPNRAQIPGLSQSHYNRGEIDAPISVVGIGGGGVRGAEAATRYAYHGNLVQGSSASYATNEGKVPQYDHPIVVDSSRKMVQHSPYASEAKLPHYNHHPLPLPTAAQQNPSSTTTLSDDQLVKLATMIATMIPTVRNSPPPPQAPEGINQVHYEYHGNFIKNPRSSVSKPSAELSDERLLELATQIAEFIPTPDFFRRY